MLLIYEAGRVSFRAAYASVYSVKKAKRNKRRCQGDTRKERDQSQEGSSAHAHLLASLQIELTFKLQLAHVRLFKPTSDKCKHFNNTQMAAADTKNQKVDFYFFHCRLHKKQINTLAHNVDLSDRCLS